MAKKSKNGNGSGGDGGGPSIGATVGLIAAAAVVAGAASLWSYATSKSEKKDTEPENKDFEIQDNIDSDEDLQTPNGPTYP